MPKINRRHFLRGAGALGGALALQGLTARAALATSEADDRKVLVRLPGFGELVPTPTNNTGEELLALPRGFQYNVFGQTGTIMADGRPTPPAHDGMAAFEVNGTIRLVRNHEVRPFFVMSLGAIGELANSYDPLAPGGTTTLVVDPVTRELVEDFVSLSGTMVNCAGGPTPWGSWITCEETTMGVESGFEQDHGYCFEVPASANGPVAAAPLKAMGRFIHEAIAIDPKTGIVYETEDQFNAGFYRFILHQPGNLTAGGRLQMLAIEGQPNYDTRTGQTAGQILPATWVDIDDPDPADAEFTPSAVYEQGYEDGGATFGRLEGAWYGNGSIYINSTSGGDAGLGQVWEYRPRGQLGGRLRLLFESTSPDVLNSPDNLCVSPRGGALVLCEDSGAEHYLRVLTRDGRIFDLAKNIVPLFENMEFAGATFSPDGSTLFVNIQTPGLTFAIWGEWGSY
jgi:uncharacterized protein